MVVDLKGSGEMSVLDWELNERGWVFAEPKKISVSSILNYESLSSMLNYKSIYSLWFLTAKSKYFGHFELFYVQITYYRLPTRHSQIIYF